MFAAGKSTHLSSDEDTGKLFQQLDKIETEGLENYVIPLAIRLQFEFAGRRGESPQDDSRRATRQGGASVSGRRRCS